MGGDALDWVVAIPTYDRVQAIQQKTLALLEKAKLPPKKIYIFADPTQLNDYKSKLSELGVNVVKGERGICHQRNAIMKRFGVGAKVVEMDDDIEGVDVATHPEQKKQSSFLNRVPEEHFIPLVEHIWKVMEREGCSLWGFYGARNAYFMSHSYAVGLAKSTAQIQGYLNPGTSLKLTVPVMEDYERCLAFFQKGQRCLRVNFLALRTVNRGPGGCASAFTQTRLEKGEDGGTVLKHPRNVQEAEAVKTLKEKFPALVVSSQPPSVVMRDVPVHGQVLYHPPGWRLQCSRSQCQTKVADVSGAFAALLGLKPGMVQQRAGLLSSPGTDAAAEEEGGERGGSTLQEESDSKELNFLILNDLKVDELRHRCKEAGLNTRGSKTVLIDRLLTLALVNERTRAEEAARDAEEARAALAEIKAMQLAAEQKERQLLQEREALAQEVERLREREAVMLGSQCLPRAPWRPCLEVSNRLSDSLPGQRSLACHFCPPDWTSGQPGLHPALGEEATTIETPPPARRRSSAELGDETAETALRPEKRPCVV